MASLQAWQDTPRMETIQPLAGRPQAVFRGERSVAAWTFLPFGAWIGVYWTVLGID